MYEVSELAEHVTGLISASVNCHGFKIRTYIYKYNGFTPDPLK